MAKSGNQAAFNELEQLLEQLQWAIYHVQRTYKQLIGKNGKPYVNSDRNVVLINEGNKAQMESRLDAICQRHHAPVGVLCMTPRKGIFHGDIHESYAKKFLSPCP